MRLLTMLFYKLLDQAKNNVFLTWYQKVLYQSNLSKQLKSFNISASILRYLVDKNIILYCVKVEIYKYIT